MKIDRFKIEIVLHIILVLILLLLSIRTYINSQEYDCDKCVIQFKHHRTDFGEVEIIYELNSTPEELYEGYIEGECPILWDNTNGYLRNG